MLKQGCSCRIGGDHSISIKDVPWIPGEHKPYVQSNNDAFINQTVSSLMIDGERSWDIDLITDMFSDKDVNLILSISLGTEVEDNWYWRHEKLAFIQSKLITLCCRMV